MCGSVEIDEINAWSNKLNALGSEGHDTESENQKVLGEITEFVQTQLKLLVKTPSK